MMIPLVDLQAQYLTIQSEMDQVVNNVIRNGRFIGGHEVTRFANNFADYCAVKHCVPCANGTDALEIALEVLGIGKGDEVIIPAFTFIATLEAVCRVGATPILCDIEPATFLIDPVQCERLITSKTKAIIPVHLYGLMADMQVLEDICHRNDIYLIEDAAQAHGAERNGIRSGIKGVFSTFSFYPGKNLGAYGDAGAIMTQEASLAESATKIANHGRLTKYEHDIIGRNSRLDTLQGAVLSLKLKYLDSWNSKRINLADRYVSNLSDLPSISLPVKPESAKHVFHLFVIRVEADRREQLQDYLKTQNIETGVHYPVAISKLKATTEELNMKVDCPNAETASREVLSLPMYPELQMEQVDFICEKIKEFYR